jgi:hypothetical protein
LKSALGLVTSPLINMTVEPITVWAAFGTFVLGIFLGAMIVQSETRRVCRGSREATQIREQIDAAIVELRDEHKELPRHNAPEMVAAIREGVLEQLNRDRSARAA